MKKFIKTISVLGLVVAIFTGGAIIQDTAKETASSDTTIQTDYDPGNPGVGGG